MIFSHDFFYLFTKLLPCRYDCLLKKNPNPTFKHDCNHGLDYSYHIILQDNLQHLANFIVDKKREKVEGGYLTSTAPFIQGCNVQ